MSRFFTPAPPRVTRAGTFDGMEKLFFENATAIETGESTAPPEALSVPATALHGGLRTIQGLSLFQKIGLGLAGSVLIAAAVIVFGRGSKSVAPATPAVVAEASARPALVVAAAPIVVAPASTVTPSVVAHKRSIAKVHRATPVRGKHLAKSTAKKKSAARLTTQRTR